MNLYDYLENKYKSSEDYSEEYTFDEFIRNVMSSSLYTYRGCSHELFLSEDEFLEEVDMDIKIDHERRVVDILVFDL